MAATATQGYAMGTRTLAGMYGLVAISITIWLESKGMRLQSQLFIWSAIALLGPLGMGLITRELRQLWFRVALAASGIIHAAVVLVLRTNLPAPNAFGPLFFGGVEAVGLGIVSAKIRSALGTRIKKRDP
jgi:hypothetical protein